MHMKYKINRIYTRLRSCNIWVYRLYYKHARPFVNMQDWWGLCRWKLGLSWIKRMTFCFMYFESIKQIWMSTLDACYLMEHTGLLAYCYDTESRVGTFMKAAKDLAQFLSWSIWNYVYLSYSVKMYLTDIYCWLIREFHTFTVSSVSLVHSYVLTCVKFRYILSV